MTLVKFKQCNLSDIYLDLTKVVGIRSSFKNGSNSSGLLGNTYVSNGTNISGTYDEPGNTVIIIDTHSMFFVDEHISEVIALIEGRDPRPAKVLFGKKE